MLLHQTSNNNYGWYKYHAGRLGKVNSTPYPCKSKFQSEIWDNWNLVFQLTFTIYLYKSSRTGTSNSLPSGVICTSTARFFKYTNNQITCSKIWTFAANSNSIPLKCALCFWFYFFYYNTFHFFGRITFNPDCCYTMSRFGDDIAETLYTEMGQSGCRRTPR